MFLLFPALLLIAGVVPRANAFAITYEFRGHLTSGDFQKLPTVSIDDAFCGSLTIDSTTLDNDPHSGIGLYSPDGNLIMSIGNHTWLATLKRPGFPEVGGFDMFNGHSPDNPDIWSIRAWGQSGPAINGFYLEQLGFTFVDHTATVFGTANIPLGPFSEQGFDQRTAWMFFRYNGGGIEPAEISIQIDKVDVTLGEPETISLLLLAVVAFVYQRRDHRWNSEPCFADKSHR